MVVILSSSISPDRAPPDGQGQQDNREICLINTFQFYHLLTKNANLDTLMKLHYIFSYMKDAIHPTYYNDVAVSCACGETFKTGSTVQEITTEICSNCHPFYTGKQKLLDTTGNVDRFKKRQEMAAKVKATKTEKKPRKARGAKAA